MKVCIIGDGLVSLSLAKVLIQKGLLVDIYVDNKLRKYNQSRTLGISRSNIEYFNTNIINIEKILWEIKKIKIYTENLSKKEILSFSDDNRQLFSLIKNYQLYNILYKNLKNQNKIKFKKKIKYEKLIKQNYKLIINCDENNEITKKFFSNRINKNYNSIAHTLIINHARIFQNKIATQIFTKKGPIAFLPISNLETSVVYSYRLNSQNPNIDLKKEIIKLNKHFDIKKFSNYSKFDLKSSNLRNYYKGNILAFGDLLHKIHPHAGQGFNMCIRDIKQLSEIIDQKIDNGLDLDSSVCYDFEKKSKDKNLIFSMGVDMIYELFNFESKIGTNILSKLIKIIGRNKLINTMFRKYADKGIRV